MADVLQANVSVKVRTSTGRLKFRVAVITSDASGTTIPAALLGMNYIDHAILSPEKSALSGVADFNYLTYAGATHTLTMAGAGCAVATFDLQAWGW